MKSLLKTRSLVLEISNQNVNALQWFDAHIAMSNIIDDIIDGDASTTHDADVAAAFMMIGLGQNPWYIRNVCALSACMGIIWAMWRSSEQKSTGSLRIPAISQMLFAICIIEQGASGILKYRDVINETIKMELE